MFLTRFDSNNRDLKEFERKFLSLFQDGTRSNLQGFSPVINTREEDRGYIVEIDLPGVKKEDIHIDIHNNILAITGERKIKEEIKEEDYYKMESFFGKFQRNFTLPDHVDADKITAKMENGVLEVCIPKSAPKDAKKIAIS